jgi:hypothetical protein
LNCRLFNNAVSTREVCSAVCDVYIIINGGLKRTVDAAVMAYFKADYYTEVCLQELRKLMIAHW